MVSGGGGLGVDQRDVTRRLLGERGEREDQDHPSSVGTTSTENEHVATDLIPTTPGSMMSTVTIELRAMSGGLGEVMP